MSVLKKIVSLSLFFLSILVLFTTIAGVASLFDEPENMVISLIAVIFFAIITIMLVIYGLKLWNSTDRLSSDTDRLTLIDTLKELSELILADDVVDETEARHLLSFLKKYDLSKSEPQVLELYQVLTQALADNQLDSNEASELRVILGEICDRELSRTTFKKEAAKVFSKNSSYKNKGRPKERTVKKSDKATINRINLESYAIVLLDYKDSKGNKTFREVEFRKLSKKNGDSYLNGICRTRKAYRTFRVDRIENLTIADIGEMIENLEACLS